MFRHTFLGTVRSRRMKLVTHMENGWIFRVYPNHAAALICPFIFFFLSNFQTLKIFVTLFSGTVRLRKLKLGTHVSRCIVCTEIRLLLYIHPFISSFFFLSNFQTLTFFFTLFSGIVRPRRLKLGTHMNSGQTYRVYRNQAAAASYSSFYFFIFLSLNFSSHFSQELWGLDGWNLVHTWTVGSGIVYTGIRLPLLIRPFIPQFSFSQFSFFFCFSNF